MKPAEGTDISVIIPNLNTPIVPKTVVSILSQQSQYSFEVIVIGLDEDHLLDEFQSKIKFINTEIPVPPGKARNIGVSASKGCLLIFIDSDAVAQPDFLNLHFQKHQNHQAHLILGGSVTFPVENYFTLSDNIATFHEYLSHLPQGEKRMVPTVNMSILKENFLLLGGFSDLPASEDTLFSLNAVKKHFKILFDPGIKVEHLPPRSSLKEIFKHSYKLGYYSNFSNSIIERYPFLKFLTRSNIWLTIFSPIVALLIVLKILFLEKLPIRYWLTLPLIFFLKCAWCVGTSQKYRRKVPIDC